MPPPLVCFAPAKINLTLRVVGRLPDGYHELESWMHKVQLFDTISLQRLKTRGVILRCPDSDLPEDEGNLVYQAAVRFYQLIGEDPSLQIILEKHIPVAAGLGGGSSDCATVLTGLNELHGRPLSKEVLLAEAKQLGADVPFFIEDFNSARATGIGECLSPLPSLPPCYIVLVNPGIAVSTGWVFGQLQGKIPLLDQYTDQSQKTSKNSNYALTRGPKTYILGRASAEGGLPDLFNDLEKVTLARHPEIELIKKILLSQGAIDALMSGSGSTVFGIFATEQSATKCRDSIQSSHPDWHVFVTQPLKGILKN